MIQTMQDMHKTAMMMDRTNGKDYRYYRMRSKVVLKEITGRYEQKTRSKGAPKTYSQLYLVDISNLSAVLISYPSNLATTVQNHAATLFKYHTQ